jgi:hypothetical protein
MYLDTTYISTKFLPDRTSNMAILENLQSYWPETLYN